MAIDLRIVYMTAGSSEEARKIGETLIAENLAACVNLIDGMNSIYRWEGAIQHEQETVIIAKTTAGQVSALTERVRTLHSYDCPCVVSLPIDGGNARFLSWISDEVKSSQH